MAAPEMRTPATPPLSEAFVRRPSRGEAFRILRTQSRDPQRKVDLYFPGSDSPITIYPYALNRVGIFLHEVGRLDAIFIHTNENPQATKVAAEVTPLFVRGPFTPDDAVEMLERTIDYPNIRLSCYDEAPNGEGLFIAVSDVPFDLNTKMEHTKLADLYMELQRADFVGIDVVQRK